MTGLDLDMNTVLQFLFAALAAYFGGKKGGKDGANGK